MDRSLDEIISERPVRQSYASSMHRILTYSLDSSAVAVVVDAEMTGAALLLLEDLAETQAPQKASER